MGRADDPRLKELPSMSDTLQFVIYLAAFLCFLVAAFGIRSSWSGRLNLIGLGLALWVFVPLVLTLRRIT
jgi:hypothetical protein